jgi:hypothetical protein
MGGSSGGSGGNVKDAGADTGRSDAYVPDRTDVAPAPDTRDAGSGRDVIVTDATCAQACPSGQSCVSGRCECDNGQTACGSSCFDTMTSTSHCGGCSKTCAASQTCSDGVCVEGGSSNGDGCTEDLARNLTLQQIAVYQAVKIPVMQTGSEVAVASRNASVVEGKDAMFRVFVTVGSGWSARSLSARLTLTPDGGDPVQFYSKKSISGSSTETDTNSTFQIFVPASAMAGSLKYALEVVECSSQSGNAGAARFPSSGNIDLGVKTTGGLKIKIIPIKVGSLLPDTSDATLANYADELTAMYPIDKISITVGDTLTATTPVDWSGTLDQVRAKRTADKPANDIYYFGLIMPADTLRAYCRSTCTTGIGFVVTSATSNSAAAGRSAVGIGFNDAASRETMAHEVGHNHGRNHSPCSTAGTISGVDPNYPYTNAALGAWGFDARTQKLYDPDKSRDIMSYCNNQWVSDYTYQGLVTRVAAVNGNANVYTPDYAVGRWWVVIVDERGARWGIPNQEAVAAEGDPESATVYDNRGAPIESVTVYRTLIGDMDASMVMVPEPKSDWYAIEVSGAAPLPFASPVPKPWPVSRRQ